MLDFLKEALHAPLRVGAVAPSSPRLAEMMARRAVADRPRQILEVGAGDGAITKALLAARSKETHLLICERSETFRPALEQLLADETNVTLFIGDVQALSDSWSGQIDVIVSGLPFASFSATLRHDLLAQFQTLLRSGGHFIAFQYTRFQFKMFRDYFQEHSYSHTFYNLPPAYVFEGVQQEEIDHAYTFDRR